MEKRHVGTLVVVLAAMAVVGAVGGNYLATRNNSAATDRTVDAGSTVDAGRQTGGPEASGGAAPAEPPAQPSSDVPTGPSGSSGDGPAQTYRLDRGLYDQSSMTVTVVSAEVTGSKLRLNLRYRNSSVSPWTLNCPTVAEDRELVQLTLAGGKTVRPESTYCSTTRPGESFDLAPGRELTSWAVFPVAPQAGSPFELSWYDFPASGLTLR
ncbi:hypothetical protein GA0070216_105130 [Micromonospora matsumotoense]|uniref:DUF4352 domain-containing protein n=1 Tax=Micromonospora matsumotoense TaxID=121616 RepID=A0A1C4XS52_9ACTN|nr:hypothetical protein [Micromonospora matsumotoense]SCF11340.1 hypothetical protein GA0070216_105130 [Micromonospora matsumotoense]